MTYRKFIELGPHSLDEVQAEIAKRAALGTLDPADFSRLQNVCQYYQGRVRKLERELAEARDVISKHEHDLAIFLRYIYSAVVSRLHIFEESPVVQEAIRFKKNQPEPEGNEGVYCDDLEITTEGE